MTDTAAAPRQQQATAAREYCYHCGAQCSSNYREGDKTFCCEGCRLVYGIINDAGLCNYYDLEQHPGLRHIKAARSDKFGFLDNEAIAAKLYSFTDGDHAIVRFYIPSIHCSSCLWLLEHLHRLHQGISQSRVHFSSKEVTVHFRRQQLGLRTVAELLASIGYEPYISLDDMEERHASQPDRKRLYRLGVAGFCFANIMMMSFPEYLGGAGLEHQYAVLLRTLNLVLALPVFFFSASEFYIAAWKGLRSRQLNIDAPIALATVITFARSVYEIISGTGGGYLDSMSGIVFFMLVGRIVQERTYRSLSFHRDYKSYFPVAVTVITETGRESRSLHDLKRGDILSLGSEEIIPADAQLLDETASIDYSFVTGESEPVHVTKGAQLYAGGRQKGAGATVQVTKPVAASYLTTLWNHQAFAGKQTDATEAVGIQQLSRYFTAVLFAATAVTAACWAVADPAKVWNSVTAMLIVACPCALLLAATFTNGNLLRIFSRSGLFLRDATVIEAMAKVNHVVFDKTGTITNGSKAIPCGHTRLGAGVSGIIHAVSSGSHHPYSRALAAYTSPRLHTIQYWQEVPGRGVEAIVDGMLVKLGSAAFTGCANEGDVHVKIGTDYYSFRIVPGFRDHARSAIRALGKRNKLSLLSGDNDRQRDLMRKVFGPGATLCFHQQPLDKLQYIQKLQDQGAHVLMIGDGLNDAGALKQSDVGITLTDDVNNFTPSCDAILDAKHLDALPAFLRMARAGRSIIHLSFAVSILYNICGLYFAMQGRLHPMIAAILMPASTLSIVLLSTGCSALAARGLRLGKTGKRSAETLR